MFVKLDVSQLLRLRPGRWEELRAEEVVALREAAGLAPARREARGTRQGTGESGQRAGGTEQGAGSRGMRVNYQVQTAF